LSAVPLLGNLFRSRAENKSKSELIVLVTPEVTSPISATDPKPAVDFPHAFLPDLKSATAATAQPKKTTPPARSNQKADPKKGSGLRKLLWGGRGKTS
jgi:Flp pilus assembly secretin CpaC